MLRAAAILTRDRLLPPPGPSPGGQAPILWNQVSFTPLSHIGILPPLVGLGVSQSIYYLLHYQQYLSFHPSKHIWRGGPPNSASSIIDTITSFTGIFHSLSFIILPIIGLFHQ